MRTGSVPKNAFMGVDEYNITFAVSLQHVDQTRYHNKLQTNLPNLNTCIAGASSFIASAARQLPKTDVWCILYPSLKHYLRTEIREVDVKSVLLSLKAPVRLRVGLGDPYFTMVSASSAYI